MVATIARTCHSELQWFSLLIHGNKTSSGIWYAVQSLELAFSIHLSIMNEHDDDLLSGLGDAQAPVIPVMESPGISPSEPTTRSDHSSEEHNVANETRKLSDDFFGPPLIPTAPKEITNDGTPRRASGEMRVYQHMGTTWWDRSRDFEDVEQYTIGGFHPVCLYDLLNGRYEVVAKLGQGGYGIVWLCRDIRKEAWRAVKILTARHSQENMTDWKAVQMLQDAGATREQWEAAHIQLPIDHFWTEGPNGRHMCLVLPLLGPDLNSMREADPQVIKDLLLQVARGLSFLHRRNIGHGDIGPHNILLQLRHVNQISKREMARLLGPPSTEPPCRIDGKPLDKHVPEYLVRPIDISNLPTTNEVSIIDFGVSFHADEPPRRIGIPAQFASPEALFGCYPGLSADVWAFIWTIDSIWVWSDLLKGEMADYLNNLEILLGPLPEPYREAFMKKWDHTSLLQQQLPNIKKADDTVPFGEEPPLSTTYAILDRRRKSTHDRTTIDIVRSFIEEKRFFQQEQTMADGPTQNVDRSRIFPKSEIRMLTNLFSKVLKYDPKERLTIDEVIRHRWFRAEAITWDYQQDHTEVSVSDISSQDGAASSPVQGTTVSSLSARSSLSRPEITRRSDLSPPSLEMEQAEPEPDTKPEQITTEPIATEPATLEPSPTREETPNFSPTITEPATVEPTTFELVATKPAITHVTPEIEDQHIPPEEPTPRDPPATGIRPLQPKEPTNQPPVGSNTNSDRTTLQIVVEPISPAVVAEALNPPPPPAPVRAPGPGPASGPSDGVAGVAHRPPRPPRPQPAPARPPQPPPTSSGARQLALVAFASATAVWAVLFAVFVARARLGGGGGFNIGGGGWGGAANGGDGPCEPGYVFAQTRRLSAHTTFFEGLVAFPEPRQALEDGRGCPVFRNLEVESEIRPARG